MQYHEKKKNKDFIFNVKIKNQIKYFNYTYSFSLFLNDSEI